MGIIQSFKNTFKGRPTPVESVVEPETKQISFSRSSIAEWIPEYGASFRSGSKYVSWGNGDKYPKFLLELLDRSALHSGIVQGKALLTAGGDILIDGMPYDGWAETNPMEDVIKVRSFLDNGYEQSISRLKEGLAIDWTVSGMYALEILWSEDYSRIVEINRIPWYQIRPTEKKEGKIWSWYWCQDFTDRREESIEIQSFDIDTHIPLGEEITDEHKEAYSHRQILVQTNEQPGYPYFGRPAYQGAIIDITTDAMLSTWYYNAADGGFQTSVVVKVPVNPKTNEERKTIAQGILGSFTSKGGSKGKIAVLFGDNKEAVPEIQPLDIRNIDQQIIAVSKEVANKIVTGHSVTTPELVGVSVPGMLGTGDISTKYKIFENTIIKPARSVIERTINDLAQINGIKQKISFQAIDPTV